MGLFAKKTPMEKWRSRWPMMRDFADHSGWSVHLDSGAVTTTIDGVTVTVMIHPSGNHVAGANIAAGAQAERTLANTFGDDGGGLFEFDGWRGVAAPGSGLIEGTGSGPGFNDEVIAAATELVARVRCAS